LEFKYDWRNRRIHKKETDIGKSVILTELILAYDGWNIVAELIADGLLSKHYVWGQDLSQTMQGASGLAGLLGSGSPSGRFHCVAYDGLANVSGLVDASSGLTSATHEYGPFGELLPVSGAGEELNRIRFSSKYYDEEPVLSYYGYRYYNSTTGRWLTSDPIQELGGINLYQVFFNAGTDHLDEEGLQNWMINPGPRRASRAFTYTYSLNTHGQLTSAQVRNQTRAERFLDPFSRVQQKALASQYWLERLGRPLRPGQAFLNSSDNLASQKPNGSALASYCSGLSQNQVPNLRFRRIPNPDGKSGGPVHQALAEYVSNNIVARGLKPELEYLLRTPNLEKLRRFVDVVAIDPATGQVVEMHQVGRQTHGRSGGC
jgi:RHS repeat-associated protein